MKANYVELNGEVIVDLTQDTATEEDVVPGKTFHKANGEQAVGTYVPNLQELNVTENDTYIPPEGVVGFSEVNVNVQPTLQEKEITANGEYTPDAGYDGLSKVVVNVESGGGSEENKLGALADRSITEVTAADLAGVTTIGEYAFYECKSLLSLTLPNSVTSIGGWAFLRCQNINNIVFSNNITSVGSYAFSELGRYTADFSFDYTSDKAATFSGRVFTYSALRSFAANCKSLGEYMFEQCDRLVSVDILSDILKVPEGLVKDAKQLERVSFKQINGAIGTYAFLNTYNIRSLSWSFESPISSIGYAAFKNIGTLRPNPSENIITLDFRKGTFQSLNSEVFAGSSSSDSTYRNKYLKILLPASVKSLNTRLFAYSENCDVYFSSEVPPTLSSTDMWSNSTDYKIYVPFNNINAYRAATNWSLQTDYIYGWLSENTLLQGENLPLYNAEGLALTWYSDSELSVPATVVESADAIYYCVASNELMAYRVDVADIYGIVTISDGINTYVSGDMVPKGTILTAVSTPDVGYLQSSFTFNGEQVDSGSTFVMNEYLKIISVCYDGVNAPISTVLGNNSWADIKYVCDNNEHALLWAVGDTIAVTLGDNNTYNVRLSDVTSGRYVKSNGEGTTNAVFEFVECLATKYKINDKYPGGSWSKGGWAACDLQSKMYDGEIYELFPESIKAIISEITLTEYSYTEPSPTTSNNRLFIAAETEVFTQTPAAMSAEGRVANIPAYKPWGCYASVTATSGTTSVDRQKVTVGTTSNTYWWERSPRFNVDYFCCVNSSGSYYQYGSPSLANGIAPCFAI